MKDFVQAGELRVGRQVGRLSVLGLGSCVAVVLYDAEARVGGLAHVLLPEPVAPVTAESRGRFASTAVPELLDELEAVGAKRERLQARLVGGASMFEELMGKGRPQIGERNVVAARRALRQSGVRIASEDVGGGRGRSIELDLADGRVRVWSNGYDDVEL